MARVTRGRPRPFAALGLFVIVMALYVSTYSSVPTSDGYTWIAHIEAGRLAAILPAYHALPMYLLVRLRLALASVGVRVQTLALIQSVNGILAASGAVLLYALIRLLGGGILWGWLAGGLLAVSFGYWYFANGELHHFSLVILLAIFVLLVRERVRSSASRLGVLIGLGALNALAVLLHQESFLFGFAAVAVLMVGRPWQEGLKVGIAYAAAGTLATVALAVAVGVWLRGLTSAGELARWFFWPLDSMGQPQPYTLGGPAGIVLRSLKGQLTALVFGTQALGDAVSKPGLLGSATVCWLSALTVLAYALIGLRLLDLWRTRRLLIGPFAIVAAGSAAWLGAYKILLQSWFWPSAPEYHVVTLPPLILLLLVAPVAARAAGDRRANRAAIVCTLALLVLVAVVNLYAGILPWQQYGRTKDALAVELRTRFRPDDLFVSSESGIDGLVAATARHLAIKDVFTHASREEGFAQIRRAIGDALMRSRRVFVYNLVPGPFTLLGINQAEARRGAGAVAARDFEAFAAELRRMYELTPALTYWEEARSPLYLYGQRADVIWQIRESSAARPLAGPA